ncbi:MAG: hypothetical protein V9E87_16325 [Gemmatimonadales bacterium]|mgnify:CR=1 FL=1
MSGEMIVLRLLHVVCGVVWVGGVCMMHYVLLPATAQAGPGAGPVMAAIPQQRLFRLMPWIAVVSMLAGVRLLGIASGGFTKAWFLTWPGHTYAVGGLLAIVGFTVAMLVSRPSGMRAGQLIAQLASAADDGERSRLQAEIAAARGRATRFGGLSTMLLLTATVAMAIARYL